MPATTLPSLSEVRALSGDYLIDAAKHWSDSADRWNDAFQYLMTEVLRPEGSEWTGAAAEAAALRVATDRRRVKSATDDLTAVAKTARRAAGDLHAAKTRLLSTVRAAEAAGFEVDEDFSLTTVESTTSEKALAARESQMRSFGIAIRSDVLALVKADEHAAAQIAVAATGLRSLTFDSDDQATSDRTGIQAIDFHGAPLPEKPKPPAIPPPEGWSPDPLMRAAQKIAHGHASDEVDGHLGDFPGMTQAQLAQLIYQKMQRSMTDPNGMTLGLTKDRAPVIYDPEDHVLIIRDIRPDMPDGGTVFKPPDHGYVDRKSESYVSIFTPEQLADGPVGPHVPERDTMRSGIGIVPPAPASGGGASTTGETSPRGSFPDWGTHLSPQEAAKHGGEIGNLGKILLGQLPPDPRDPDSWS